MSPHFLHSISLRRESVPDWGEYPFSVPAIQRLETLELHPKVTFFVGENGSGKSTLLEAIAEKLGFSLEGGTRNSNLAFGEHTFSLTSHLRVSRAAHRPLDGFFLRAESFYNFATKVDEEYGTWGYGGKKLHEQSHGESFLAAMTHRMGGHGVYLLDEPEAALSPQRQLSMLVRLHDLAADFSQFIIATHSPIILAYPDAWIYQFSPDGIERIAYEDTEHFQITRNFLRDPSRMLERLLRKEDEI
jgi:predicted ATPase